MDGHMQLLLSGCLHCSFDPPFSRQQFNFDFDICQLKSRELDLERDGVVVKKA